MRAFIFGISLIAILLLCGCCSPPVHKPADVALAVAEMEDVELSVRAFSGTILKPPSELPEIFHKSFRFAMAELDRIANAARRAADLLRQRLNEDDPAGSIEEDEETAEEIDNDEYAVAQLRHH